MSAPSDADLVAEAVGEVLRARCPQDVVAAAEHRVGPGAVGGRRGRRVPVGLGPRGRGRGRRGRRLGGRGVRGAGAGRALRRAVAGGRDRAARRVAARGGRVRDPVRAGHHGGDGRLVRHVVRGHRRGRPEAGIGVAAAGERRLGRRGQRRAGAVGTGGGPDRAARRLPDGLQVVALDPGAARITPGTNLAAEPRDTVHLDDVPVGGAGGGEVAPAPDGVSHDALLLRGALSRAALIAGAAGRILDITVTYTGQRQQFGRPVARFQAVAAHLVRLAEQTETVRMAARVAAANTRAEPPFLDIAAAATVAGESAGLIAAAAHQATGAMGMTREYELGQLTRRLWSWREEYGGERVWSTRLGAALTEGGAGALWPAIARGAAA
ncbi:hypothetical protein DMP15_30050 [Pseudonocardia sp. UM4_GMWB1]